MIRDTAEVIQDHATWYQVLIFLTLTIASWFIFLTSGIYALTVSSVIVKSLLLCSLKFVLLPDKYDTTISDKVMHINAKKVLEIVDFSTIKFSINNMAVIATKYPNNHDIHIFLAFVLMFFSIPLLYE